MSNRLITTMAILGGAIGGYVPVLFGDTSMLDGWSILAGLIGGLLGIWLGVVLSKRLG